MIQLFSAEALLNIIPNYALLSGYHVGICAVLPEGTEKQLEIREFNGVTATEAPVMGNLNGLLAQWLIPQRQLPLSYMAGQGQCVGRDGTVYITTNDGGIWVDGDIVDGISGTVVFAHDALPSNR